MEKLLKKIIAKSTIELISGLHIGGNSENIEIGGIDNPVIKAAFKNNQPYIPGSSIRGKMRCLLEQINGASKVGDSEKVNKLFGYSNDKIRSRLIVRDAYICDELHEYSGESAQGEAMAEIAGIAKKVIAMTATLINGYAKGTFYLLFRLKPRLMLADGFKYNDARKFCQRYGVVESIYETPETKFNVASKNRTQKVREKFLPGISPIVYSRYLMENTVFLSLYDMAKDLPDYEEIPVACEMSESVEKEYRHMEDEFRTVMRKDRRLANKLLSPLS